MSSGSTGRFAVAGRPLTTGRHGRYRTTVTAALLGIGRDAAAVVGMTTAGRDRPARHATRDDAARTDDGRNRRTIELDPIPGKGKA